MAAIVCKRLTKHYGAIEVVRDFDLEVRDNEFVVFLGPSGCGKSTILRMMAGLEPITGGELVIGGKVVNDLPAGERGIAMVFQNYALYPHMTVANNIAFGLRRMRVSPDQVRQRVAEVAATLGLEPYLQRLPAALSGGQQQRVAIARAMSKTPQVFLFDEPLSNLDAKLRNHMRVEIARLHQRLKTTTVYVTHDQHEAMTLADRIVLLREGRIEQVGTPREIYEHPCTRFVAGFIGTPPMNLLEMSVAPADAGWALASAHASLHVDTGRFDLGGRSRVCVGIRPVHLQRLPAGTAAGSVANVLRGVVDLVEYLGNEVLVTLDHGGADLAAQWPVAQCPRVGEPLAFTVPTAQLHLFDVDTGASLARPLLAAAA